MTLSCSYVVRQKLSRKHCITPQEVVVECFRNTKFILKNENLAVEYFITLTGLLLTKNGGDVRMWCLNITKVTIKD